MTFHVFNINVVFFKIYNTKKMFVKHCLIPIYTFYTLFFSSGSFNIWFIAITKVQHLITVYLRWNFDFKYLGNINLRPFFNVLGT